MLLLILLGVVIVVVVVVTAVFAVIGRRRTWPKRLIARCRWPFRWLLLILAALVSTVMLPVSGEPARLIQHGLVIGVIGVGAWFVAELFLFFVDNGTERHRLNDSDTAHARTLRTQLEIIRRLVVVVIVVIAVGSILMTFEEVRAVGASVLASAGIASVVAGLAAQSLLGNLFAGVQLAFNEAIRVGDIVVVQGEYGRIQEITLSYVVLEVWDQRTLVLPCTYFTSTPFENWTKLGTALVGIVLLDLDWRVRVDDLRTELDRILAETDLWDGVTSGVQVTDATGGLLRVRITVSAADASASWDLRCVVRERLADWVRRTAGDALPARRVLLEGGGPVSG